jgi:peroxiredoxin-like protein
MIAKKEEYVFNALAEWTSRRSGIVEQKGAVPESIDFSAPPEFHGEENKWSPETLLLASVAACFISTFDAIAEYSGFAFNTLSVNAEGTVTRANGKLQFTHISIKPTVEIQHEADFERAVKLLEKTKESCLISRSLSAEVILLPEVKTIAAVA